MALGGGGINDLVTIVQKPNYLVIKSVTMGEGVSKIIKYCMTSFMDDP